MIDQFEGEEGLLRIHDKTQEDAVALPQGKVEEFVFVDPGQFALVAKNLFTAPFGGGEEVHIFAGPDIAHKGDYSSVAPLLHLETSLLAHFAQHAFVGAFIGFAFAAYAYPLVVAGIVLFLYPMEHQILVVALHVA